MENEDLIIGDNQDSLLRQNQYLESGDIHNSDFSHIINDHHHNFDADHNDVSIDYIQDLGSEHTHETSDEPADSKAIVVQNHGNGGDDESHLTSENHDSAVVEYRDFRQNEELSMMPVSDGNYEMPLAVRSYSVPCIKPVELTVGQEFPDVHSCRRAFRDAAIAFRFEMHTIKSDKTRFTAKCATEGCPWRIHAAKLPGLPTFTIRTIHEEHTCGGIRHLGHQQASVQWVAESVETHLLENPHSTPKEILEEIYRAHGITLSYKQAWRAKERVMASVRGSFEEEYRLLPQYCDQIVRTNPGSIAVVYGNPVDNCFERLFISFQASIYGFLNACRHLIVLDRTLLKSKYHGTLLFATGFDGDGAVFPLAFGLVDDENVDNWMWFHSELHNLLEANTENMPKLTILSDRQNGIIDGVEANFPTAFHGFCLNQLIDRFVQDFNSVPSNLVWEAATALTPTEFGQKMLVIENMSQQAVYWLRCIDPRLWAVAYFEGTILAQFAPKLSESLNTLIRETSGLPVIQMMEHIRRKLMTWFSDRREMSLQWTGMLVPSAERQVFEAIKLARSCQVVKANDAEFEVSCNNFASHTVDIRCRTCSCRGWQLRGLPCVHGVAALISCGQNVYKYTEDVFTVANYRKAYSQAIHPIPDKAFWNEEYSDDVEIAIRPPKSLQPLPGKPRKKRVRAEDGGGRVKRAVHCSRCHQTGHFRTTCAVPI